MSILLEHSHHTIDTHTIDKIISNLGVDHHGAGFIMGKLSEHAHDQEIKAGDLHTVLHKLANEHHSGIGSEQVSKLKHELEKHLDKEINGSADTTGHHSS